MPDEVTTEVTDGVMVITMNRPDARNAVNTALAQQMAGALDDLDRRDDVVVGILTGAGGNFCAGMDLKAFARGERPQVAGRGFAGLGEAPPSKPLIAAVEGYALAGGCELVLSCDMVVAGTGARFGVPEVKRGLVPAAGGLFRLPARIPYQVAMELILTGNFVDAARAHELGLVNRLIDDGGALEAARALSAEIAANGPLAVRVGKEVVARAVDWPATEAFTRQSELVEPVMTSEDAKEGAAAFAEKRAPRWQGK
jgi:enoyl-CoA hydratase